MAARSLLFPLLMGVFLVALLAWAFSTPVDPPLGRGSGTGAAAAPGDTVVFEFTAWYGGADGDGFVFQSSQEERYEAGLPTGDFDPSFSPRAAEVEIPTGELPATSLEAVLVGRAEGETFTTPRIAPEDSALGVWETGRSFNRTLQTLDVRITLGDEDTPWRVIGFDNLTQYQEFWQDQGVESLGQGTQWPCEGPGRWECRSVAVEEAGDGTLTYDRVVDPEATFALADLLGLQENAPGWTGEVRVSDNGDGTFSVRLVPVVDDLFQLRQGFGNRLPRGSYLVTAVEEDSFTADYSPNHLVPPALIGQHTWYDLQIVSVVKAGAERLP